MTTTPTVPEVSCPKCGGAMWDQKNGKYPWKPGTPVFKCRTKECATNGGVYWEDNTPKTPTPKPPVQYKANVPESELPPFLRSANSEDAAELAQKVGFDTTKIGKDLALYTALTEYVLRDIAPLYEKSKIGMSPESAAAATATLYIQAKRA